MKAWLKYGVFVLIILVMIVWLGGFLGHREGSKEFQRPATTLQKLELGVVEKTKIMLSPYTGHVTADRRIELSTKLTGRVKGVFAKEGQGVKAGQLLISIDAEDIISQASALDHQVAQAEQALRSAMAQHDAVKKTFERYSALLKEGAITQQE
ncbi:MAG: biotin/lipoyl-binding protein, partial [Aquificaceae bacterium]|nr:biotin/lipoyl-binding protein [Aquificaceae bacterium]